MAKHLQTDLTQLDFESLVEDSITYILQHGDPIDYLQWLQQSLPHYHSGFQSEFGQNRQLQIMLASLIGRMIWNATPLPEYGFLPQPLPKPQRNSPCVCGSGKKYKHCCASMPQMEPLSKEEIWPIVLTALPAAKLKTALASKQIPIESLFIAAEDFTQSGKFRKALDLIIPLLDNVNKHHSIEYEYALNMACNLYDALGYSNKKQKLLDRVIKSAGRSPLRSGAYQRMATIAMDSSDHVSAWNYFNHALQDDPEALSLGLLEVQLLLAENQYTKAQQRANFWAKKYQKLGFAEDEYPLDFLIQAAEDPNRALLDVSMQLNDGIGENLLPLLDKIADRANPQYSVVGMDEQTFSHTSDANSNLPDEFLQQLELLPEPATNLPSLDTAIKFIAPDNILKIEQQWYKEFYFDKPFSTQDIPFSEFDPWDENFEQLWLQFLQAQPAAFDSLEILDDIATALHQHPMSYQPWHDEKMLKPVLLRAMNIISSNLQNIATPQLCWMLTENRPLLRSMARLIGYYLRNDHTDDAYRLMIKILQFNPTDNHGFRALLANAYLIRGENQKLLQLEQRYADDINPEIMFGQVLALYRLDRQTEAKNALCHAIEAHPKIVRYLTATKIKKPNIDHNMVTYGGENQAWIYRHEMRDEWLATKGILDWLKKTSNQC